MTDRRFLAANAYVAHSALEGIVDAPQFAQGDDCQIVVPHAGLCATPDGAQDKQMLFGHPFTRLATRGGWSFGFDPQDGYVGYVAEQALGPERAATHKVTARLAHVYEYPTIKDRALAVLSFGARLALTAASDDFFEVSDFRMAGDTGYVARQHVTQMTEFDDDPARIAQLFLGTPYLWGGDTGTGIDCSGLVQQALTACNIDCPRDSDMQENAFQHIDQATRQRGDLVHWKGHVGMLLDPDRLIHANAHHMMVAIEPLDQAITRIGQKEFGEVTGYSRPVSSG